MLQEQREENFQERAERTYKDFINPQLEIRRIFAETWGTFLLVFFSCGIKIMAVQSMSITPAMEACVSGLIVMTVIYFMGTVSGAHLNPCVTLAFAIRGNFPWQRVGFYILAQIGGGIAAAFILKTLFGSMGQLGATLPEGGMLTALIIEIIMTTGLINTILGTAAGARNIGHNGAIAVGGYITIAHMLASPISGSSMNPIRSLAPDMLRADLSTTWIYIVGPLIGMCIAVGFEWILKGKATPQGTQEAQGSS